MIRVLVADDHAVVRTGLQDWLSSVPDIEVIDVAEDGGQAAGAHEIHHVLAVLAGGRVVVVAEQQDRIGGRADLVAGSLDDGQPQIARPVRESV